MPTDRALVLRRFPYSESSLVVHVLTREHGRVHLIARGAYRARSRYFAVLDLFDTLELSWSHSPKRELQNLRSGRLVDRRRGLTASLEGYRAGLSILELCELGSDPGRRERGVFDLAARCLGALHAGEPSPDLALAAFELGFLERHGLAPAVEGCAACGREAPPLPPDHERAAFSAGAGGRLCLRCAEEARASGRRVGTLPLDVLALAGLLLGRRGLPPAPEEALAVPPERLVRLRDFVERFLDYHLEHQPRTHRAFLAVPNRNAPTSLRD